ncbi:winged helix-turn-helix domain-containing protein [Halostella litorea]|uniref:winged helix-turn-helix domain-containing protein n=1 Tax=Halostella litorea TaxID=2528831 RepID=UPI001092809D|nr:winged helix-turn-helix domain-containing protein [Halostella litorea]
MSEAGEPGDPGDSSILDCDDCMTPAEAFAVVGNETRLSILEALWRADERPVSFSDLRKAVGMRDSAQFNYHLDKLRGQFVRRTDEGYTFRHAGWAVIHAVQAGSLTEQPEIAPFEVEGDCSDCGGPLAARYEDERVVVDCVECARTHANYPFPPGGLDGRTTGEVMAAFNQRVRHLHCLMADGVCPECSGTVETTVERDPAGYDLDVAVRHECQRCRHQLTTSVGQVLLDHAEIVSFYRDHGVDLNQVPFWTLDWCTADEYTTVLSDDPWRLRLDVPIDGPEGTPAGECEGERLTLTVDEDLVVREVERSPAGTATTSP